MWLLKRLFCLGILVSATLTSHAQLLWRVSSKNLPGDSFLFGTNHAVGVEFCDSIPGFSDAFSHVEQYFFEVTDSDATSVPPRYSAFMPNLQPLSTLFTEKEMAEILDYLTSMTGRRYSKVNYTPHGLMQFILNYCIAKAFPDRNFQECDPMDIDLQKRAEASSHSIHGLETLEVQQNLLYGQSLEEQAVDLLEWVRSPDNHPDSLVQGFRAAVKAYRDQDLEKMGGFLSLEQPTQVSTVFLEDRNAKWAIKMMDAMNQSPAFFAIGAGHLLGDSGLISLLQNRGYSVSPIR